VGYRYRREGRVRNRADLRRVDAKIFREPLGNPYSMICNLKCSALHAWREGREHVSFRSSFHLRVRINRQLAGHGYQPAIPSGDPLVQGYRRLRTAGPNRQLTNRTNTAWGVSTTRTATEEEACSSPDHWRTSSVRFRRPSGWRPKSGSYDRINRK